MFPLHCECGKVEMLTSKTSLARTQRCFTCAKKRQKEQTDKYMMDRRKERKLKMKALLSLLLLTITGCRFVSIPEGHHVEAVALDGSSYKGEKPVVLLLVKDKDSK